MATMIKAEGIGKKYLLRHQQHQPYHALRDVLAEGVRRWSSRIHHPFTLGRVMDASREEFWALQDVSFEVGQSDRVGIIGRNGAGKSTLLKILSRITEPTVGQIAIRGRIASLLEVGTGFHPELTGRENIYLNGAILGMTKHETQRKFDEIVDFAEVEKFLDTPVKRYSSGMFVRLAFAVAAHLEPDILIIDEVLAVGDAQFQRKCLGKMEDVSKQEGRTVLFVSHNMDAIAKLCNRGIMLHAGQIVHQGKIEQTILFYQESLINARPTVASCLTRGGSGGIVITDVWVTNDRGDAVHTLSANESAYLNMKLSVSPEYQNGKKISIGFGIDTFEGRRLFTTVSSWVNDEIVTVSDRLAVQCCIPSLPFISGKYLLSASVIYQIDTLDSMTHCASFEISDTENRVHANRTKDQGELALPSRFKVLDS
jgi:lipopolysaccharide transport system ATP-binding protein